MLRRDIGLPASGAKSHLCYPGAGKPISLRSMGEGLYCINFPYRRPIFLQKPEVDRNDSNSESNQSNASRKRDR